MPRLALLSTVAVLCGLGVAHADPATYALVVGANRGGPGQAPLQFAESDARRFAALLVDIGGHAADRVDLAIAPSPDQLRARLDRLTRRVAADVAAGREARLVFYYSGHARAAAIDLGAQPLPLAELRGRLLAVPAALTVVVLDACQSGAFSRVKGATPAADFSFNSRQQLAARGVAVLASSTASELSQESEHLRSSYFTHHLLVGLRGAGDANRDGAVTIDEAYRYAYHQTLVATSTTAVGGQHVSLEVDLVGHGEVALAYPRAATAAIALPAALAGQVLVRDRRADAVVAEVTKAAGAAVRVAVAPGDYEVVVRTTDRVLRCPARAPDGGAALLDPAACAGERIVVASAKGALRERLELRRPFSVMLGLAAGPERDDAFTDRLRDFGYERSGAGSQLSLVVLRRIERRLWVGGAIATASAPTWQYPTERAPLEFGWQQTSLLAVARGAQPLGARWFSVYAQVAAGVALAATRLDDQDGTDYRDVQVGPALSAGAGLQLFGPDSGGLVISTGYQLDYAPAIDNDIGDTHAVGGHRFTLAAGWSL